MIPDIRSFFGGKKNMVGENVKSSKKNKSLNVTQVREKKNGYLNPVIVNFQNGELNNCSGFDVTLTANQSGKTNVEVKSPSGHVYKESTSREIPRPTEIVLIRNKKTNKVKLIEVDSALLINSALLVSSETSETEKDYEKEVKTLHKTFGGKKVVTRLEQRERLNLSKLPIADDVKKAVEDIKVDENVSLNDTESESIIHLLPPCNRTAEKLSDVYVITEILCEQELQALNDEISAQDEKKFNPQEYSQYFIDCYAEAKKSEGDIKNNLAGLLFVETLIKFLRTPSKKLAVKKAIFCSFSSVIHDKLLNEFCVKTETSVTRPVTMRDKSLCYIMAISLICCNYKINLKLLSTATAVHLSRLTRLARAVGAVQLGKQENYYTLKLPLPSLPKASSGRMKRK